MLMTNKYVNDLLHGPTKTWNHQVLRDYFPMHVVHESMQLPTGLGDVEDKFV